jgi:hypothetical protein
MKKLLLVFMVLSIISVWYNIYQFNTLSVNKKSVIIEKWKLSSDLISTNTIELGNYFDEKGCNVDFISNIGNVWDFSALLFKNTFIFKTFNKKFICIKSLSTNNGLYVVNDFWSEFEVNYKKKGEKLKIISLWKIKYNFIAKEKKYWGKYELFIKAEELIDINVNSKGIILLSKNNKLYSYEVFWDNFDIIKETNKSKELLNCFNNDNYLMSVYSSDKIYNEWLLNEDNLNINWTVFWKSRFILKYINNIKNKITQNNKCFKLKK